jgi:NAD(P)-dependent dehydrogenase (short-subunit alcohol dehydrogenase family)
LSASPIAIYLCSNIPFGQGIAIAFVKAGVARIAIASRSSEKLEVTKQELLNISPNVDVLVIPTDIASEDSVDHLEETVKSKFGIPDILVNGVGLWSMYPIVHRNTLPLP